MLLLSKSDAEILAAITPLMDNMMAGSTAINHAQHSRDFTERMLAIVTPDRLMMMCRDYQARWGWFGRREFVALFRRRDSIAVVWRQFCSLSDDEYVAEVVFVQHDGRLLIDHALVY